MKKLCACDEDQLLESTKNQQSMQDIRTSSGTRESVLRSYATLVGVLFTHTWSLAWKSTLLRKRNSLKNEKKCTQFSTSACLAIQTTMNRMESANFLMMNLVHRNLQLVTQNVWCAGRCVRIDELYEVLHIAGSVSIDAVGFGGLAAIVNTNLCPAATASLFTLLSFSWLQKRVLCYCLACLNFFIQVLSYRTLSAYV